MASRIELQEMLESLLGSPNVYYQPPASKAMEYPAIKYSREGFNVKNANNSVYILRPKYQIIVIDTRPDNPVIEKLMKLKGCTYDRQYISDNLYHDVLTLYL